jgi:LuxR family transcriptional regulator, maltose regulon positive regulatory protein
MVLTSPLLETKVHIPRPRTGLVTRPRLGQRLNQTTESKLTLVSAPAGFGKSTLVAEWLADASRGEHRAAWLSLDEMDNDPVTFWTYVIAALQTVVPGIGEASLSLLKTTGPRFEGILAPLLNELAAVPKNVVLVLDDYHVIDASDLQDGMAYFIDHMPPDMHLVITTRADPALPLARLRARGELQEIRAADLRFTPDEAAVYFNDVLALGLGANEVAALEGRTEGWIAALQLAGLSMQGRGDVSDFIAGFAGDDRYVVDYLVEEVLHRQSDDLRTFLLQTSILAHMSGALCDAVTGQAGSRTTLEALDRANLFVIPLDARREWYRYHHLFADVLRARLTAEQPDLVPALHRRASQWFERNGERDHAIEHALAGKDFERAAHLIELAIPELRQARRVPLMRRWFGALPEGMFAKRPVLSIGYVGALMANGEVQDVEPRLRDAERWLEPAQASDPELVVADEVEFRRLPSAIAMYRAAQAQLTGDLEGATAHARRAYDLGTDDPLARGGAAGLLALADWSRGELDAAHALWTDAKASLHAAGHAVDAIAVMRPMAEIRFAQGRLREAMRTYEQGLELTTTAGGSVLRGAADMHVGLAELALERNDLDMAADHLQKSSELGGQGGLPQHPYRWRVAMALVREAEGDVDAGISLLDEAERVFVGEYFPVVRPIPAVRARMQAAHGRLSEATDWIREVGLSVEDELSYLKEYEHVTLARLLIGRARQTREATAASDAVVLLERLLQEAEAGGRERSVVETLVLLGLVHHARGNAQAALPRLSRALALAEPEGYVRTFAAEGAPMTALLEAAVTYGIMPDYAGRLLAAGDRPRRQPLEEPLSERELEVLRLLGTDLDGPGIARQLVIGLSTVRSHTKSIYAKLGVSSRRAAVRRGEELRLLERAPSR